MEKHLNHLRSEVIVALRATYALQQFLQCLSIKEDVKKLNENSEFWMLFESSTRLQVFLSLRRIFENMRGTHNFQVFVNHCVEQVHLFSKTELRKRKFVGWEPDDSVLDDYLNNAYEATKDDFHKLSSLVRDNSKGIKSKYLNISSKVIAHAVLIDYEEIKSLYKGTTITEIESALNAVWHCYGQVWQMYHNGHAPIFEIGKYPYGHEIKDALLKQVRRT